MERRRATGGEDSEEHFSCRRAQDCLRVAIFEHLAPLVGALNARKEDFLMASTDIRSEIVAGNTRFMEAFGRGDAAGVAALYTAGGQLLPPDSAVVAGRDAIQALWKGAMGLGLTGVTLETLEVEGHGETAIEVGRYTLRAAGGQVADVGKYVVIWKREGGAWRLHRDIWNASQPAPAK